MTRENLKFDVGRSTESMCADRATVSDIAVARAGTGPNGCRSSLPPEATDADACYHAIAVCPDVLWRP
jgi:hypothetical protein